MRLSVDSAALADPRFKKLGRALGVDWRQALGMSMQVWFTCYDRRSPTLAADDVDILAERDGFAAAMVAAGLAVGTNELHICGVSDRIAFLLEQKARGQKSGRERRRLADERAASDDTPPKKKGANTRSQKSEQTLNGGSQSVATNPSASASASAPDLASSSPSDPEMPAVPATPFARVRADVCDRYRKANGHEHTWLAKQNAQVSALLRSHSADEVIRRNAILYTSPPTFLRPPFDLGTLVGNFDKLVKAAPGATDKPRFIRQLVPDVRVGPDGEQEIT